MVAATAFAEATVVKKNAKGAKELGSSTRSTRLKDLTPTVEKAACATAAAVAPRIQTAAHCPGRARSVASGVSEPTSSHGD